MQIEGARLHETRATGVVHKHIMQTGLAHMAECEATGKMHKYMQLSGR